MDKYKVAIVDDDEVALENLSFELGKDARFFLKGTARNGKQGKKLIAKVQQDGFVNQLAARIGRKSLLSPNARKTSSLLIITLSRNG